MASLKYISSKNKNNEPQYSIKFVLNDKTFEAINALLRKVHLSYLIYLEHGMNLLLDGSYFKLIRKLSNSISDSLTEEIYQLKL